MIHELKDIFSQALINQKKGLKNVLASVVALEGSSYRKPGVRMLIAEDGSSCGAVSGGCVEKEIILRAKSVFKNEKAKVITYDGRYRLGCEGILYILIEPFFVSGELRDNFSQAYQNREQVVVESHFIKEDEAIGDFGSRIFFQNSNSFLFSNETSFEKNECSFFRQELAPPFRLLIIGGEHDAVKLCNIAANLGWQVEVITPLKEQKQASDFKEAYAVRGAEPESFAVPDIENNTAIVIMNHSFVRDLKYLVKLSKYQPLYIGILGAPKRREQLFHDLLNYAPEVDDAFLESIYTPAGLHIGARTPEEISISIIAEILSVIRKKEPFYLRELSGKIHQDL